MEHALIGEKKGSVVRRPLLFVECTHTFRHSIRTGIQRVVRNVLQNVSEAASHWGFDVAPIILEGNHFVEVDLLKCFAQMEKPKKEKAREMLWKRYLRRPASETFKLVRKALGVVVRGKNAQMLVCAPKDEFGLASLLLTPQRVLKSLLTGKGFGRSGAAVKRSPCEYGPLAEDERCLEMYESHEGDIMLLLDASWNQPIFESVDRFKQKGGKVAGVVYDLIPITHPYYVVEKLTKIFRLWFGKQIETCEALITISRFCALEIKDNLERMISGNGKSSFPRIGHFYLGCDFDSSKREESLRLSLRKVFLEERSVFIVVGTIEPRKNHEYILDAFERHWTDGGKSVLMFIWNHTWKSESLMRRVQHHSMLGKSLVMMNGLNESELDYAYRHAKALVIASAVEGFGLPIVEALGKNLPVLCSDIPVFREIGGSSVTYFSLDHPESLSRILKKMDAITDRQVTAEKERIAWPSWKESTNELIHLVVSYCTPGGVNTKRTEIVAKDQGRI